MKSMDTETKREKEKKTVAEMITLFCRKNHEATRGGLWESCRELLDYAWARSDACPFMENKTFCSNCKVHCYKPEMREKIREVMRFAGPRMITTHPIMAISHVMETKKEKRRLEK